MLIPSPFFLAVVFVSYGPGGRVVIDVVNVAIGSGSCGGGISGRAWWWWWQSESCVLIPHLPLHLSQTDRQTDNGWMQGWTYPWTDGCMDEQTNG